MENIVRLTPVQILCLSVAMSEADLNGRTVRVATGKDATGTWFKYDSGYGWTPPLYGEEW